MSRESSWQSWTINSIKVSDLLFSFLSLRVTVPRRQSLCPHFSRSIVPPDPQFSHLPSLYQASPLLTTIWCVLTLSLGCFSLMGIIKAEILTFLPTCIPYAEIWISVFKGTRDSNLHVNRAKNSCVELLKMTTLSVASNLWQVCMINCCHALIISLEVKHLYI